MDAETEYLNSLSKKEKKRLLKYLEKKEKKRGTCCLFLFNHRDRDALMPSGNREKDKETQTLVVIIV